jgi:hypothetical protein
MAANPVATLPLSMPLASVCLPVAVLPLLSPFARAPSPMAVLPPKSPLALAKRPIAMLVLAPLAFAVLPSAMLPPAPLAFAFGPHAKLSVLPAAVAPPPSAVPGGTVVPVGLPTQMNCARAGGAISAPAEIASSAEPASNVKRWRPETFDMAAPEFVRCRSDQWLATTGLPQSNL